MKKVKKIIVVLLALLFITANVFSSSAVAMNENTKEPKLVAYYKFDGDLKDSSGYDNNGTSVGNISFVNGALNKGAKLDGNSYIEVEHSSSLNLSEGLTFSVWMYKEDIRPKTEQPILQKNGSSIDEEQSSYVFADSDNQPYLRAYDEYENFDAVYTDKVVDIKKWTLVTVTYDENYVKIYYDGVLKTNKEYKGFIPPSNGKLLIGCNSVDGSSFFKGVLDDLRMYDGVLSPEAVKALYIATASGEEKGIISKSSKLVAHYKFDNDLKDYSALKNDGLAVGNITFEKAVDGKGAKFDGASFIEVKDSDYLDLDKAYTFSVLINKANIAPKREQPILSKQRSSIDEETPSYEFADSENLPYVRMFDQYTNFDATYSDNPVDINKWILVTATYDGESVKFYYNGVLKSSKNYLAQIPNSSGKLLIGFNNFDGSSFFKGTMDDLRIYNYALNAEEIKKLSSQYQIPTQITGASDWAVKEIQGALESELITDKVLYDFQTNITREEFCELAVKLYEALSGKTAAPVSDNPFIDTSNSEVLKANKLGIVNGISINEFAPNNPVTRQEISVMMYRTLKAAAPELSLDVAGVSKFNDEEDIADWAIDSVRFFNKNGIIKGVGDTTVTILPKGNTSKEQAIVLIGRTFDKFKDYLRPEGGGEWTPNNLE